MGRKARTQGRLPCPALLRPALLLGGRKERQRTGPCVSECSHAKTLNFIHFYLYI